MAEEFMLSGYVFYVTGSCEDDHTIDVDQVIEAEDEKEAIGKTKGIAEDYKRRFGHNREFSIRFFLGKFVPFWQINYISPREAEPAVPEVIWPAKPAVLAEPGGFEEMQLKA